MRKLLQGKGGELVNYDYFDVAEGTGIKNFYAGQSAYAITSGASQDAVTRYFLTTDNTIYSNRTAEKMKSIAGEVWELGSNVNYDVMFNLPKIIYGQARLIFTQGGNVGANTTSVLVTSSLYQVAGSTATLMASGAAIPYTMINAASNQVSGATLCIPYDLTSQKWNFKVGDKLRLNVQLFVSSAVTTNWVGYGCDPADRDDVSDVSGAIVIPSMNTTQLKLQIPFRLDI